MLNIYYGAETTDKEKFVFDNIKGRTLLLVPDQFSLQAERDAFFYVLFEDYLRLMFFEYIVALFPKGMVVRQFRFTDSAFFIYSSSGFARLR